MSEEAAWQEERDVGIIAFANAAEGFDAVLRHRFTDFKVNEIDKTGAVCKITSTAVPPSLLVPNVAVRLTDAGIAAAVAQFSEVAGAASAATLKEFLDKVMARVRRQLREQPTLWPRPPPDTAPRLAGRR